jgi:hypothetical protein
VVRAENRLEGFRIAGAQPRGIEGLVCGHGDKIMPGANSSGVSWVGP